MFSCGGTPPSHNSPIFTGSSRSTIYFNDVIPSLGGNPQSHSGDINWIKGVIVPLDNYSSLPIGYPLHWVVAGKGYVQSTYIKWRKNRESLDHEGKKQSGENIVFEDIIEEKKYGPIFLSIVAIVEGETITFGPIEVFLYQLSPQLSTEIHSDSHISSLSDSYTIVVPLEKYNGMSRWEYNVNESGSSETPGHGINQEENRKTIEILSAELSSPNLPLKWCYDLTVSGIRTYEEWWIVDGEKKSNKYSVDLGGSYNYCEYRYLYDFAFRWEKETQNHQESAEGFWEYLNLKLKHANTWNYDHVHETKYSYNIPPPPQKGWQIESAIWRYNVPIEFLSFQQRPPVEYYVNDLIKGKTIQYNCPSPIEERWDLPETTGFYYFLPPCTGEIVWDVTSIAKPGETITLQLKGKSGERIYERNRFDNAYCPDGYCSYPGFTRSWELRIGDSIIGMRPGYYSPPFPPQLIVTYKPKAYTLSLTLNPSQVQPIETGETNYTTVWVSVTDADGNPVPNKEISLTAEAVANSGGHSHDGGRPAGCFEAQPSTCQSSCERSLSGSICPNGEPFEVEYYPSCFGGVEKITATLADDSSVTDTKDIQVRVPLAEVGASSIYRLTGQTGSHPSNRHLAGPAGNIFNVA